MHREGRKNLDQNVEQVRYNQSMDTALIQSDPSVMMGKPVIAGTRITVELILERMAAGESTEQLLAAHPHLTRESISAALTYAVEALRNSPPKAA